MKHHLTLLAIWIVGYLLIREFVPADWWIGAGAMAWVFAENIAEEIVPWGRYR